MREALALCGLQIEQERGGAMTMPEQTEVKSTRFQLVTLSDGIYAAIAVLGGGALCNAGIVDLGDRTVVFDTFNTPLAARELRATAERLTGRPAT